MKEKMMKALVDYGTHKLSRSGLHNHCYSPKQTNTKFTHLNMKQHSPQAFHFFFLNKGKNPFVNLTRKKDDLFLKGVLQQFSTELSQSLKTSRVT